MEEDEIKREEEELEQDQEQAQVDEGLLFKGLRGLGDGQSLLGGNQSPLMGGPLPQGYGSTESVLQNRVDEAADSMRSTMRTMQDIIDEGNAERQRRADELARGLLTEEEMMKSRASATHVANVVSALSNIANGIMVSRGARNATVPDGYTLAYQHWNDIENRNKARRQEYDKLTDSIFQSRLKQAEMQYGLESQQYKQALAQQQAYQKEQTRRREQKEKNDFAIYSKTIDQENQLERIEKRAEVKANSSKTSNGSKKQPVDFNSYRSFTYAGNVDGTPSPVTITIPEGMDVREAYMKIASGLYPNIRSAKGIDSETKKRVINDLQGIMTGNEKDDEKTIKKIQNAIALSKTTNEQVNGFLGTSTQPQPQNNEGNGGKKPVKGFGKQK